MKKRKKKFGQEWPQVIKNPKKKSENERENEAEKKTHRLFYFAARNLTMN
jgi:hypothetical protein